MSSIVTFEPSFELSADSRVSSSLDLSILLLWFLMRAFLAQPHQAKPVALYLVMFFLPFSNFLINSPDRLKKASAPIDFIS